MNSTYYERRFLFLFCINLKLFIINFFQIHIKAMKKS